MTSATSITIAVLSIPGLILAAIAARLIVRHRAKETAVDWANDNPGDLCGNPFRRLD